MLTFEPPYYQIKDVLVFRDYRLKKHFWYLAGLPKLSVDTHNKPQFSMLIYRDALDAGGPAVKNRDALGGAFLMLGVDCGVDVDTLKSEVASLAEVDGDITLAPVPYTSGTAQIVVLDYQPTPPASTPSSLPGATPAVGGVAVAAPPPVSHFVKAVVGSTTPNLLVDQRAIFSISLDADAAELIEKAYENDMSPIGVIYRLEFAGLRPAISVSAEVDYKKVYDQLKIGFQLGVHHDSSSATNTPAKDSTADKQNPTQPNPAQSKPALPNPQQQAGTTTPPPLAQPIQIRIQTGGALGTAVFRFLPGTTPATDTTGTAVTTAAPTGSVQAFRWNAPSTPAIQIDFPAGTYVAGDQFVVNVSRTIQSTFANPTSHSPAPTVVPAAAAPPPPPPALNTPPPGTNTSTTSTTSSTNTSGQSLPSTSTSDTSVGVDVNIDYTMQQLVQSGAIKINIVREQEGKSVDDMQKEAMDLIRDDILKVFFTPQLAAAPSPQAPGPPTPPAPPPSGGLSGQQPANQRTINPGSTTSGGTKVTVGFQLKEVHEESLTTVTFDYSVVSPVTMVHAPNGFFSALLSKTNKDQLIKRVDLNDDFFKTLNVSASTIADFTTTDLKSVVLDMAYGGTLDEPETILSPTFTAADATPKTFQTFVTDGEMAYRYRTSYYFGQNALVGAQTTEYHTDWHTTLSRALVVNPPIDVAMLHVYVTQALIDWDLIAQIETTLCYDDPDNKFHAERTFLITPTFQNGDWIVRLTNPAIATYTVQNTWILKDNERRISGPVQTMSAAQCFISDPFVDRLPIILQPEIDQANVSRATVAFHYQDTANQLDVRKLVELTPPYKTTTVSLPLMNKIKRSYSYQTTLIKTDGSAENRAEVTTDAMSVVIADGSQAFDVNVTLIGDLVQAGLTALEVDLRSEPLDGRAPTIFSHLFQPGEAKWAQRLMLRTDRPDHTYQVQTTAFYTDKDPVQSDWNSHNTSVLVIQPSRLQP